LLMMSGELKCSAWVCNKGATPLVQDSVTLPPLTSTQVHIKIRACGICKSDVDCLMGAYDSFGMYHYPIVAGHEGVGEVLEIGTHVQTLKVGDIVGLGVYRDCCGACKECAEGKTNLCRKKAMMFVGGAKGCFSEFVRIEEKFAFKIPEGISIEHAGPLMCAGITVFAPFRNHNIKAGDRVGVVGIGGLGHLALQFAKAFGCEVSAFSTTSDKEAECRQFGAHHFYNTKDEASKKSSMSKLDFLLMTAGGPDVDYKYLMSTLVPGGTLIIMGITGLADIPVSPIDVLLNQKTLCGSAAGSQAISLDVLRFCALHNIKPTIQTWPGSSINEAIEAVKSGKIRYRAVVLF